jgi:hypothetical protein
MREKTLEKKLREKVKAQGGIAVKLFSPYLTGLPDRLVLMPGGRACFAELKSTGENPTPTQVKRHDQLRRLGFVVAVIDTSELLEDFMGGLASGAQAEHARYHAKGGDE